MANINHHLLVNHTSLLLLQLPAKVVETNPLAPSTQGVTQAESNNLCCSCTLGSLYLSRILLCGEGF